MAFRYSTSEFRQLSPFHPHGDIKVPGTNLHSASVEGVWQGLKMFPNKTSPEGVAFDRFENTSGKAENMKRGGRTAKANGVCHYGGPSPDGSGSISAAQSRNRSRVLTAGLEGVQLRPAPEARKQIYLPTCAPHARPTCEPRHSPFWP